MAAKPLLDLQKAELNRSTTHRHLRQAITPTDAKQIQIAITSSAATVEKKTEQIGNFRMEEVVGSLVVRWAAMYADIEMS